MIGLLREYLRAGALDQRSIDWLAWQGVPRTAMVQPWPLMLARVKFDAGSFDRDPAGERVFVIPVEDGGEIADLVAWQPQTGRLVAWAGQAFALGQDKALQAATYALDGALRIHRSPLSWLQAERDGIVIVDASRAYPWLSQAPRLTAEDAEHSRELRQLVEPPRPRTRVIVQELAA